MVEQGLKLSKARAEHRNQSSVHRRRNRRRYKRLSDKGVRINATVSFSVPQAVAAAEVIKQGYVTIMVGRLDDHLQSFAAEKKFK